MAVELSGFSQFTFEAFMSLVLFSIVTSITPGPNNIMLLASGVNFGLKKTVPHSFGISIGFLALLIAVGVGIGSVLTVMPSIGIVLKLLGGAYLLYLSYRIAFSRAIGEYKFKKDRALSFIEAALFQWVNPKAWTMAISAMTVYGITSHFSYTMLAVAIIFATINWPCVFLWAVFGNTLRGYLDKASHLKWFNICAGSILALSIIPILIIEL